MKLLIGIASCHRDRALQDNLRQTWLKDATVDYKFFLGRPAATPADDEVFLDAPDGYDFELSVKVQAMVNYALEHGYDYLFKCDTDTCVYLDRLLACDFEKYLYMGGRDDERNDDLPAHGGPGYFLDRFAMEILRDSPSDRWSRCEDWWVKGNLQAAGVFPHYDNRFSVHTPKLVTFHPLGRRLKTLELMRCASEGRW